MASQILKNYPQAQSDIVLKHAFDFEKFVNNTGLHNIFLGYGASTNTFPSPSYNLQIIQTFLSEFMDVPFNNYDKIADTFLDLCFTENFFFYMTQKFPAKINTADVSQMIQMEERTKELVRNVPLDSIFDSEGRVNFKTVQQMDSKYFKFGEAYYSGFNVETFKETISEQLGTSFRPYFFFSALKKKYNSCGVDSQCNHIYMLGLTVFSYYLFMTLFLVVFGTEQYTIDYINATQENDVNIKDLKTRIVQRMDDLLAILYQPPDVTEGKSTDLNQFYNTIKTLSLKNVKTSNNVVENKKLIDNLQNNLRNYSNLETQNLNDMNAARIAVWLKFAFLVVLTGILSYLTAAGEHGSADILSISVFVFMLMYFVYQQWFENKMA
jgi:hypothetical protein